MKREVKITKEYCDVCGTEATGEFYRTEHLNGDIFSEFNSSMLLDLCPKHAEIFARIIDRLPSHFIMDRYDNVKLTNEEKEQIISEIKSFE